MAAWTLLLVGCNERKFTMPTGAMRPTIPEGGIVIADTGAYKKTDPARWDMVVFRAPETVSLYTDIPLENLPPYVMRIVGLPGETIDYSGKEILVDGRPLTPPSHLSSLAYAGFDALDPSQRVARKMKGPEHTKLGSDEFFILGDFTQNSIDGRFWGALPRSAIVAKVIRVP